MNGIRVIIVGKTLHVKPCWAKINLINMTKSCINIIRIQYYGKDLLGYHFIYLLLIIPFIAYTSKWTKSPYQFDLLSCNNSSHNFPYFVWLSINMKFHFSPHFIIIYFYNIEINISNKNNF